MSLFSTDDTLPRRLIEPEEPEDLPPPPRSMGVKVYIAGPMTGIPQFNFPAFDEAARVLRAQGYEVVSPAEIDRLTVRAAALASPDGLSIDTGDTWGDFLSRDVKLVADEVDIVAVLPGWEKSRGARLEVFTAELCKKPVLSYPEMRRIDPRPALPGGDVTPRDGEVRQVNATTGGEKGQKLARFDLVPWRALWDVAEHYGIGANKYAAHNWRRGYEWSLSIAAMGRHLAQFAEGQDHDPETGTPHPAAIAFHALALLTFMREHPELDDRWAGEVQA